MPINSRLESKETTTSFGTNANRSGSNSYKHVEIISTPVTTTGNLDYKGEDDSQKILSSSGGNNTIGYNDTDPHRWGHVTPSGSRFEINDAAGSEKIDIVHNSGSGVTIDPDGSIYISTSSKRGGGISAPFGDLYFNAQGDIVINGSTSISVKTTGDLNVDVGGSFNVRCDNYKVITKNMNETIDGTKISNITYDNSQIIGGVDRKTVAGDSREQISRNKIVDVGKDFTTRVTGTSQYDTNAYTQNVKADSNVSISGNVNFASKGDYSQHSQGSFSLLVEKDTTLETKTNLNVKTSSHTRINTGGDISLKAGNSIRSESGNSLHFKSAINTIFDTAATLYFGANGIKLNSNGVGIDTDKPVGRAYWADYSDQAQIAISTGGFMGAKPPLDNTSKSALGAITANSAKTLDVKEANQAQVVETNDIIDNLTSVRKYPDYQSNAVLESANIPTLDGISNDYSGANQGNINPTQTSESLYTDLSEPQNKNTKIFNPNIKIPSRYDLSARISKYFTLGMLLNATNSQPITQEQYNKIGKNFILFANNILDPIKKMFPDMLILTAYRQDGKHEDGLVMDIIVSSKSASKHAEIAIFAKNNLPCSEIFLERNSSGKTCVHLKLGEESPDIRTYTDSKNENFIKGIQISLLERNVDG